MVCRYCISFACELTGLKIITTSGVKIGLRYYTCHARAWVITCNCWPVPSTCDLHVFTVCYSCYHMNIAFVIKGSEKLDKAMQYRKVIVLYTGESKVLSILYL